MILVFMQPRNKQTWEDYQQEETLTSPGYHISHKIPVALPPCVAGETALQDPCSYFR